MKKRLILIVDDEGYDYKCEAMREIIESLGMQYDVALTLEEASGKVFSNRKRQYDAIILDKKFPSKEGENPRECEGEVFLTMLEKRQKEIPVLIHSSSASHTKSKLVVNQMSPCELWKLRYFLRFIA